MRRRFKLFLLLLGCVFLVIFVALLIVSVVPRRYAPPPLPNPNGYQGIVQASRTIAGISDYSKLNEQQLAAVVRSNSAAVALLRSNLDEQIQVPVSYSMNFASAHLADLERLKGIARALAAEGRLAQIQNRPADAARSGLDIIRLGVKCPQGGLLMDAMFGTAIENIGMAELQKLTGALAGDTAKNAALELEQIEAKKQTWKQVLQQEHYWSAKTFTGFSFFVARLFSFDSRRKVEAKAEKTYNLATKNTHRFMIDLAARAYELENGRAPTSVTNLVPAYLKSVPADPFTGEKMTYLP